MQKFNRSKFFIFSGALLTGMVFALMWRKYQEFHLNLTIYMPKPLNFEHLYTVWLQMQGYHRIVPGSFDSTSLPNTELIREDKYLYEQVRILCIIITAEAKKAKAIKNTWAKHCNIAVFYGSYDDEVVPVARLPNSKPWPLLCGGILRAWKNYHKDFDWVLVVDDWTFAIPENLRYLVAPLSPSQLHYLGHLVKDQKSGLVYNSAKSGYVISHQLMKTFAHTVLDDDACDKYIYHCASEDCILGKLFHQMGAFPKDTRDHLGRGRFNSFSIQELLIPNSISLFHNYWRESIYVSPQGENCCSDYAVTFHKITPNKMYLLEYTVYHLKVFQQSNHNSVMKTTALPVTLPTSTNVPKSKRISSSNHTVGIMPNTSFSKKTTKTLNVSPNKI